MEDNRACLIGFEVDVLTCLCCAVEGDGAFLRGFAQDVRAAPDVVLEVDVACICLSAEVVVGVDCVGEVDVAIVCRGGQLTVVGVDRTGYENVAIFVSACSVAGCEGHVAVVGGDSICIR